QHQRRPRPGAEQGDSAAIRERGRIVAADQPDGHGHPAQRLAARNGAGMTRGMAVIVAGGGTGGHLYPGIAVARELQRLVDARVTFAGTAAGIESRVVPREGFELDVIRSAGLKGKSIVKRLLGLCLVPIGLADAMAILRRRAPQVVIGVGGYSSGPVVLAAVLRGIPTLVMEQNAVP